MIEDAIRNDVWYRDAVIYEVHVRAFYDSNGDGIGDFAGMTRKLDYLHDLGITAIWLLPFYESPLKDDGYDISDYCTVHPFYGSMADFRRFLHEAHRRDLRVITELVLNHTSDQHAWFQRARRAPKGSPWRDYYVWSDDPNKYREARIIFQDFEHSNWTWDDVAHAYYWHRFYSHQPDLNYDNPAVWRDVSKAIDFWLAMGVDGLRLDAVPYLFERDGTNCENLPETHELLRNLRRHVDERFHGRMLLGEANQWPEEAAAYFGQGDECHMAFHFPLMPRMFMAIRMEDKSPIVDILEQTPHVPEACQWALFLRNHDELTLEMVTDEERDYMYRMYAQDTEARINLGIRRRLAPLLGNHRRRIELMNGLLFSLPGTPVLYYGDEIGMGDNIYLGDRNGVRTPMQWSADRNAGFSRANPQKLYLPTITDPEYHHGTVHVEAQQQNPHSLLSWTKRLIALRKEYQAFGRGSLRFVDSPNRKVLSYVRQHEDQTVLVVANLSRFVQFVELDLRAYEGMSPVEMWGNISFPAIGDQPYFITLAPHSFYWFALRPQEIAAELVPPRSRLNGQSLIRVENQWHEVFQGEAKAALERALPAFLIGQLWFGTQPRRMQRADILDHIPMQSQSFSARLCLVRVEFTDGDPETLLVPLKFVETPADADFDSAESMSVVVRLQIQGRAGVQFGALHDATWDPEFATQMLKLGAGSRRLRGQAGELRCWASPALKRARGEKGHYPRPRTPLSTKTSTVTAFGDQLLMKTFRQLGQGPNPDLEIGHFLTEHARFEHTPALVGAIEYDAAQGDSYTLATMQQFIPNRGSAWNLATTEMGTFLRQALAHRTAKYPEAEGGLVAAALRSETASDAAIGAFLAASKLIGQRTAEMHLALASAKLNRDFIPERFSQLYQRSLYQSLRSQVIRSLGMLRDAVTTLPSPASEYGHLVLESESKIDERYRRLLDHKIGAIRFRCHGNYHLGKLLYTGDDFFVIDFEGEPERPLSERRIKRTPLRDVASMLRSMHYAAFSALLALLGSTRVEASDVNSLHRAAGFWYQTAGAAFLREYLAGTSQARILPSIPEHRDLLLDVFLLDKSLYELAYDLRYRPASATMPLLGILQLLGIAYPL